jgi:hypothetical protein
MERTSTYVNQVAMTTPERKSMYSQVSAEERQLAASSISEAYGTCIYNSVFKKVFGKLQPGESRQPLEMAPYQNELYFRIYRQKETPNITILFNLLDYEKETFPIQQGLDSFPQSLDSFPPMRTLTLYNPDGSKKGVRAFFSYALGLHMRDLTEECKFPYDATEDQFAEFTPVQFAVTYNLRLDLDKFTYINPRKTVHGVEWIDFVYAKDIDRN